MPVRDALLTDAGGLHGGVFAAVAEALASRGTALAVIPQRPVAMGHRNDTNVLARPDEGVIDIEARVLARGERRVAVDVSRRGRGRAAVRILAGHRRRPPQRGIPRLA